MGCTQYGDYEFIPIRSSEHCPICGSRKGRCSRYVKRDTGEVIFYRCKYKESSKPSQGWYIHMVKDFDKATSSSIPTTIKLADYKQTTITEEDITLWDKVYKSLKEIFFKFNGAYLYKEHYENLISRGFSDIEIRNMGFFSIPKNKKIHYDGYQCKLTTAIINELLKSFKAEDLLKVPGFYKVTVKEKDFVIFKNTIKNKATNSFEDLDAYFIPYYNYKNQICAMQYRLSNPIKDEKGKKLRYLWFSSKDVSCGSPIDYYKPMEIVLEDVLLVTEGAIKAKFAASKLKVRSLAEAGVGNYRNLVKTIQEIEKIEGKRYKILLALDMDKYSNDDVIKAEISTVALLKSLGYSTTILEWNEIDGKGIDDKLVNTSTKGFRYLNI